MTAADVRQIEALSVRQECERRAAPDHRLAAAGGPTVGQGKGSLKRPAG